VPQEHIKQTVQFILLIFRETIHSGGVIPEFLIGSSTTYESSLHWVVRRVHLKETTVFSELMLSIRKLKSLHETSLLFVVVFMLMGMSELQAQDLSISQSVDNSSVAIGDNVTFTITVTNESLFDASGVVVTNSLPDGVSNVTTSGVLDAPNNLVTWNVGNVPANSSVSLDISRAIPVTSGCGTVC